MKRIWKYPVRIADRFTVPMPEGAEALSVQMQGPEVQMWAIVEPDKPSVATSFRVIGTGHDIAEDTGRYVGTFQMHGGGLVFHLFQERVR